MSTEKEPGWNKRVKRQTAHPLHVTNQNKNKVCFYDQKLKLLSLLQIGKCQFAGKMVQKVNKIFNFEGVKTDKILPYGGWDAEANRDNR
jgi:hypothetical protein